ncbi:energy-coupling factor transporter transmembrane component T [Listeria costaricensis]|uniref:energy-coupling factor transporter transmembrane component T n=1 Tax=Listeria costaricensis TaxID=2026604 RepID=UPI00196923B4|nr:energy-coupling factor transporter transmembrane component T [Listeria costaricensis]
MERVAKGIINLNPLTKLLAVLVLGVISLMFPSPWLGFGILLALMIMAMIVKLSAVFYKLIFGFGIPLTLMLVFIQGFYSTKNKTVLLDLGFAQLGLEGTMYALKLVSALLVFVAAFFLMNQTTKTSKLVAALIESGLNAKIGYLVLASLNVVPQMNRRMKSIKEAQESRGVSLAGNIIHRFKTFLPLIGPVILSSLIDAQERGMALETRGFGLKDVKVTSLTQVETTMLDYAIRIILLGAFIGVALFALFGT